MAISSAEMAKWLIANQAKKGTSDFDKVLRTYDASMAAPVDAGVTQTPAVAAEPERAAGVERPGILGTGLDILQAGVEVPFAVLTGGGAAAGAGLKGLYELAATGGDGAAAAQAVEGTQQKYTYAPRGAYGQAATNALGELFGYVNRPGEEIASAGYPELGTGVTTGLQGALMVLGGPAIGGLSRAARGAPAMLRQGITAPRASARQQQTGAVSLSGAPAPMPAPAAAAVPPPAPPPLSAVATPPPPPAGPTYSRAALLEMGRQFNRDNPTATAAERAANMTEMARLSGGEARVADVAGRNLLDYTAIMPGETNTALSAMQRSRAVGRPERLDPVVDIMSGGAGRAATVASDLVATQRATATPLYNAVNAIDVVITPALSRTLIAIKDSGAFARAREIATANEVPFVLDDAQLTTPGRTVNMRELDLIKQGVDDLVTATREKQPTLSGSYVGLVNRYKTALDTLTGGAYKAARDAFAGPAKSLTALEKGRKSGNRNAGQRAEDMADMGPAELQHYRIGAAEQLREQIGDRPGQNRLMNEEYSRNVREQLQEIASSPAAYEETLKIIKNEKKLKELESVGQGSQTAARLAMDEDMATNAVAGLSEVTRAATAGDWKAGLNFFMKYAKSLRLRESVRNEIGRALLSKDPNIFGLIEAAQAEALAARASAARAAIPAAVVTAGPQPATRTNQLGR
jgi:hypothetical protein